ncbi:MAG: hypothetical protein LBC18_05505 [Opitutaceae bacterium]|jgi:PBP1b-binding outer membrane lipoprotein LpoB|nr:hypothetical protein [Opitutaceae bacterium]
MKPTILILAVIAFLVSGCNSVSVSPRYYARTFPKTDIREVEVVSYDSVDLSKYEEIGSIDVVWNTSTKISNAMPTVRAKAAELGGHLVYIKENNTNVSLAVIQPIFQAVVLRKKE